MNRVCLILDDERTIEKVIELTGIQADEFRLAESYDDFIAELYYCHFPDIISFDHDINSLHFKTGKELTGLDAAKFIVNFCHNNDYLLPKCYCHSSNPAGKANIESYIASAVKSGFVKQVDF